jgi:hypothetical protein
MSWDIKGLCRKSWNNFHSIYKIDQYIMKSIGKNIIKTFLRFLKSHIQLISKLRMFYAEFSKCVTTKSIFHGVSFLGDVINNPTLGNDSWEHCNHNIDTFLTFAYLHQVLSYRGQIFSVLQQIRLLTTLEQFQRIFNNFNYLVIMNLYWVIWKVKIGTEGQFQSMNHNKVVFIILFKESTNSHFLF